MAGVRKSRDKGVAQHVDLAVDMRRAVADGVELTVKLYLVMGKLRLPFWVQVVLAT